MARYYFDISLNEQLRPDEEGLDLPDDPAARHEAVLTLAQMAAEEIPRDGRLVLAVGVADQHRRPLFRAQITFEMTE